MQPAARISDMHVCPMFNGPVPHVGGPILPPGCPTVLIGFLPAARVGDMATCVGPPDAILPPGSPTVLIGNQPAARMGDMTSHGGSIILGCFTVLIGTSGSGGGGGGGGGGGAGGAGGSGGSGGGGAGAASPQAGAMQAAQAAGLPFCAICNLPGDPPPPTDVTHSITITSTDSPHFVPDVETLEIAYDITGPVDQVSGVKLIVTPADDDSRILLERALPGPFEESGMYEWNGSVTDGEFDGFINLKNMPYKIQLILNASSGEHRSNTKTVDIELEAVEVEVSAHDSFGLSARDKPIVEHVKDGIENHGGKGYIVMNSPIFKMTSPEMNDDSAFTQFRDAWGRGVPVPCLAKVWLKGKDNTRKSSSKALYGSKLLWDVKLDNDSDYEAMLGSLNLHTEAKDRLMVVSAYHKDHTNPPGRAAHKHFGGLRCRDADRGGDKYWAALGGSWACSDPAQRTWCAHTELSHQADPEADSGIKFIGGRMAGDTHTITAYLDIDGSLDTTQDAPLSGAPANQKSNAMKFVNWRRIEIVKNYKIGAATTELNIGALKDEYKKASMTVEPKAGVAIEEIQSRWKTEYQRVINAMGADSDFVRDAALQDPGLFPVKYRDHADYISQVEANRGFFGRVWNRICRFFGGGEDMTLEEYRAECDNYAYRIYTRTVQAFPLQDNGLTFFKFGENGDHNQWHRSFTSGIAPSIRGYSGRNKSVFFVFKRSDAANTLIHEVGHLVFLAHAPGHFNAGENPAGHQPNAHADNQWCVMSYHSSNPDELCGTCILKLSGWNYTKINKDGSVS